MSLLVVENLHVFRGGQHVLRGVNLTLGSGACMQLTGPNGAGKTTLLRAVAGLCEVEQGSVSWRGRDTRRDPRPFHIECSYLGHEVPLKGDLTALENLRFSVGLRRTVGVDAQRAALDQVGARSFEHQPLRSLSAGQRRRVALAALLLYATPLWLLDEPTTNLDAAGQALLMTLLEQHLAAGGLVLAAVHHELDLPGRRVDRLELRGRAA
jgi:heme exporter protein A